MIALALRGEGKEAVLFRVQDQEPGLRALAPSIDAIARGSYRGKERGAIRGTGYVVHSLEAALWCFWGTNSYREAILQAANLGDDADTTAAVCGQIAGAHYGLRGIPDGWLDKLAKRQTIERVARDLYENRQRA
jgi:ADP-ribosyl-[dinitrogen reductase] hydrolase